MYLCVKTEIASFQHLVLMERCKQVGILLHIIIRKKNIKKGFLLSFSLQEMCSIFDTLMDYESINQHFPRKIILILKFSQVCFQLKC